MSPGVATDTGLCPVLDQKRRKNCCHGIKKEERYGEANTGNTFQVAAANKRYAQGRVYELKARDGERMFRSVSLNVSGGESVAGTSDKLPVRTSTVRTRDWTPGRSLLGAG